MVTKEDLEKLIYSKKTTTRNLESMCAWAGSGVIEYVKKNVGTRFRSRMWPSARDSSYYFYFDLESGKVSYYYSMASRDPNLLLNEKDHKKIFMETLKYAIENEG